MQRSVLDQVWSPTQHIALWLGVWLSDLENYDHLLDALDSLGRPTSVPGTFVLANTTIPNVIDCDAGPNRSNILRLLRAITEAGDWHSGHRPLVRLILSEPGDVPALSVGTDAAEAVRAAGSAIAITGAEPGWDYALIPVTSPVPGLPQWHWYTLGGHIPEPAYLSPGEADLQLTDAVRVTAATIAAIPCSPLTSSNSGVPKTGPRLMVDMLDDHLGMTFAPDDVPWRALGVLARADRVSSILAVAQDSESGHGSAAFDTQLIPLWRKVRRARMSAAEYAVQEWTR